LRLPIKLFSVKPAQIMKSPKTKFVVISAIGLASIFGIFVFAQSPKPGTPGQDLPIQLVTACARASKGNLMHALAKRPKDTYKFRYQAADSGADLGEDLGGGTLPPMSPPPSCYPEGIVGNATQRATFKNTQELRDFLTAADL
jgi:hypothetical protein